MMVFGIIVGGSIFTLIVGTLLIGLSGDSRETKNIGYKNEY